MARDDEGERLLATLANGVQVISALLTDHSPPLHVYRVVSETGHLLHEFATLVELNAFLLSARFDGRQDQA